MFKLYHQTNQQINEDYYVEYKKENDKCKELENILNYLFNLDYYINSDIHFYEKYYNKQNTIYIEIENYNKLPNNITKLRFYNIEYLNNLPLHLKWLSIFKVNCNLSPNLIYLDCNYCDIKNLPKSLQFLFTFTNIHNEIILNNINIKNKIITLLSDYYKIIFNNNIIFNNKIYYKYIYILK